MTKDYSIVVAHPDDEALWASSIIERAKKVVICFIKSPASRLVTDGRLSFARNCPDNFIFLDLDEARHEKLSIHSIFSGKFKLVQSDYAENEALMAQKLEKEIDTDIVFTHNPWGEYGHPEHIQVHRVVASLCELKSKSLYTFGYYSAATFRDRREFLENNKLAGFLCLPTDKLAFHNLRHQYILNECWTWHPEYLPPSNEYFFRFDFNSRSSENREQPGHYIGGVHTFFFFKSIIDSISKPQGKILFLIFFERVMYFPLRLTLLIRGIGRKLHNFFLQ